MAGLVPAIHVFQRRHQDVDARDEPGHDDVADWSATNSLFSDARDGVASIH
jgi:hypothetical protein